MMKEQRHINLHLPTDWNRCTTAELESIAAAVVNEQAAVGRYRPFLWERVKLHIVLDINGLKVLETDGSDDMFLVQRGDEEPWTISTGQLASLCERLNWLTNEKASPMFVFPYPEMTLNIEHGTLNIVGPPPLLDGYTWREYRWLTDWMQAYMRNANALAMAQRADLKQKSREAMQQSQQEFLAVLFKAKERPVGGTSGSSAGIGVNSQLSTLNSQLFDGFSPIKWQVILFWWSSLMQQLAKKFPRVFKPQPVGKGKRQQTPDTPWDFYNRVTSSIQKYIGGLSAENVDAQPYGVTLQQLEMMADEAAEMEKIKK